MEKRKEKTEREQKKLPEKMRGGKRRKEIIGKR